MTPGAVTRIHPIDLRSTTVLGVEIVDGPVYAAFNNDMKVLKDARDAIKTTMGVFGTLVDVVSNPNKGQVISDFANLGASLRRKEGRSAIAPPTFRAASNAVSGEPADNRG